jgi:hypothetical protein
MANKLHEHPVFVVLTLAAAVAGLVWFLTGKDFPHFVGRTSETSTSSSSIGGNDRPDGTTQATGTDTNQAVRALPDTSAAKTTRDTAAPDTSRPSGAQSSDGSTEGSTSSEPDSRADRGATAPGQTGGPPISAIGNGNSNQSRTVTCSDSNTGKYGFTNTKSETVFTVILYYREESDEGRIITVPPGQTQYVYEFPAGAHNYIVTYRAMVPIMSFPPGAPTMPQDVIYLRGEIDVEQCKTGSMEIR